MEENLPLITVTGPKIALWIIIQFVLMYLYYSFGSGFANTSEKRLTEMNVFAFTSLLSIDVLTFYRIFMY